MSDETKCKEAAEYLRQDWDLDKNQWVAAAIRRGRILADALDSTEQKLAVAVAALKPFAAYWGQLVAAERHPSESVVPLPPNPEDYRAASEALKKIGATP